MTEQQPGGVLGETARLLDGLRRGFTGAGGGSSGPDPGDVWADAVRAEPPHVTGATQCRDCPICRGKAIAHEAAPDVRRHLRAAGRSLAAAAGDVASAVRRDRVRAEPAAEPRGPRDRRPEPKRPAADAGDPWASATQDPAG